MKDENYASSVFSSFILHPSALIVKCGFVSRILWRSGADGHFSAATIARRMVASISRYDSNQPERSAGRVCPKLSPWDCAFCLVLHQTRVTRPPRRRDAGALLH